MAPISSNRRRGPDVSASSKERNEYIPNFIAKKPFYVAEDSIDSDYLEHQRLQKSADTDALKWYSRGEKTGPAATKFRKGACENCGAMSHKTKECLSRPRKHGARWTGKDIEADEIVQNVNLGWEAKRDRWNGYDTQNYGAVVEEYQALEDLKRQMKDESSSTKGVNRAVELEDDTGDGNDADEGAKYEEETDMGRQQSTSTRNLRIREDTAKYLLNLDLDSAKYDPKTRSMVDSGATADQTAALVAEEGFMRASGDAAEFKRAQRYAWEMQDRGDRSKIHLQANPTSGEYLRKKENEEKLLTNRRQRQALLEKYGGDEYLQSVLPTAAIVESERYVEYDEQGAVKGAARIQNKSCYPEDVRINNHRAVWGSWWNNSQWGYSCCHSVIKNSYCTGNEGRLAIEAATHLLDDDTGTNSISQDENLSEEQGLRQDVQDLTVVAPAARLGAVSKDKASTKAPKRTLKEMRDEIDEAKLEEYRKKRVTANDPMKDLLGRDELVH